MPIGLVGMLVVFGAGLIAYLIQLHRQQLTVTLSVEFPQDGSPRIWPSAAPTPSRDMFATLVITIAIPDAGAPLTVTFTELWAAGRELDIVMEGALPLSLEPGQIGRHTASAREAHATLRAAGHHGETQLYAVVVDQLGNRHRSDPIAFDVGEHKAG